MTTDAFDGDPYEAIADIAATTIALGAVPRDALIRRVKEQYPDPEDARRVFRGLVAQAEAFVSKMPPGTTIAYEAEELARVQEEQRKLK
jgi:hypothetical protein